MPPAEEGPAIAFVDLIDRGAAARDRRAYLTRVARNLAIDSCRADRLLQSLDEADLFAMADPAPSAETTLLDRDALAWTVRGSRGQDDGPMSVTPLA